MYPTKKKKHFLSPPSTPNLPPQTHQLFHMQRVRASAAMHGQQQLPRLHARLFKAQAERALLAAALWAQNQNGLPHFGRGFVLATR